MKSPRVGAKTRAVVGTTRGRSLLPGACPTTAAAARGRVAPPRASAPLGPTHTATGAAACRMRCTSASSRRREATAPLLSSWITSAALDARSAWSTACTTKSATMSSTRPLTSITSTVGRVSAAVPAAANAGASVPSTRRPMASLRLGGVSLGEKQASDVLDPVEFCSLARLVIVAGKGGVGKTTVSAALARMAARHGLSTLIIDVEGKGGLAAALGGEGLRYSERGLIPGGGTEGAADVKAPTLTPDDPPPEYLTHHRPKRISKRL